MEYCFVEKWHNSFKTPQGAKLIALTPEASLQLDRCKINHMLIEDFGNDFFGPQSKDAFLVDQVKWTSDFDKFIQDTYSLAKTLDIRLASLYFIYLKCMIDNIILTSKAINFILNSNNTQKIWFIPKIYGDDKIILGHWFYFGESLYLRISRLACKQKRISFQILYQNEKEEAGDFMPDVSFSKLIFNPKEMKAFIYARIPSKIWKYGKYIKELLHQIKCVYFCKGTEKRIKKMLILKNKDYVYQFCKDAASQGFELNFKEGDYIFTPYLFPFLRRVTTDTRTTKQQIIESDRLRLFAEFKKQGLMDWINKYCEMDITEILQSRIEYFLFNLFPNTLKKIEWFISFYKKFKIDFVLAYSLSSVDDFAAIEAAKASGTTKRIGFAHGVDAIDSKSRFFMENVHFDYYFVNTLEEIIHLNRLKNEYKSPNIHVEEYHYFRNRFDKKNFLISKIPLKYDKPLVLYFPIIRESKTDALLIGEGEISTMEYLRWHNALIDYFASRKDYIFIWKSYLQPFERGDTVSFILKDKNINNIKFYTSMPEQLRKEADRTLFDIPSTAFYENIFSGLPVCSLFRPYFQNLRPEAIKAARNCIKPYSTVQEGINVIEEFLNSDRNKYIVPFNNKQIPVPKIILGQPYQKNE